MVDTDEQTEVMLEAVLSMHRLKAKTQCGAISMPLVHYHGNESEFRPGPLREMRCTEDAGHGGLHKDSICCFNFKSFADWQVVSRSPRTLDSCTCGESWPCATVEAAQEAVRTLEALND